MSVACVLDHPPSPGMAWVQRTTRPNTREAREATPTDLPNAFGTIGHHMLTSGIFDLAHTVSIPCDEAAEGLQRSTLLITTFIHNR